MFTLALRTRYSYVLQTRYVLAGTCVVIRDVLQTRYVIAGGDSAVIRLPRCRDVLKTHFVAFDGGDSVFTLAIGTCVVIRLHR